MPVIQDNAFLLHIHVEWKSVRELRSHLVFINIFWQADAKERTIRTAFPFLSLGRPMFRDDWSIIFFSFVDLRPTCLRHRRACVAPRDSYGQRRPIMSSHFQSDSRPNCKSQVSNTENPGKFWKKKKKAFIEHLHSVYILYMHTISPAWAQTIEIQIPWFIPITFCERMTIVNKKKSPSNIKHIVVHVKNVDTRLESLDFGPMGPVPIWFWMHVKASFAGEFLIKRLGVTNNCPFDTHFDIEVVQCSIVIVSYVHWHIPIRVVPVWRFVVKARSRRDRARPWYLRHVDEWRLLSPCLCRPGFSK